MLIQKIEFKIAKRKTGRNRTHTIYIFRVIPQTLLEAFCLVILK